MITITDQSAGQADVLSHGERLADLCPAETSLRRSARINLYQNAGSTFSLLRNLVDKARPSGIVYGFGEHPSRQALNIQILDSNQSITINNFPCFFVVKILALIADVVMKTLQQENRLAPSVGAFLPSCYAPLQSSEFSFGASEPTWVVYRGSVAKCGKHRQANINTNHAWVERQRVGFAVNAEQCKPPTRLSLDRKGFDCSFERAVQLDMDASNFGQPEPIAVKRIAILAKRQTVIASRRFESRVARFLPTLTASKECNKSKLNAPQNVFKYLRVNPAQVFAQCFDFFQLKVLVKP